MDQVLTLVGPSKEQIARNKKMGLEGFDVSKYPFPGANQVIAMAKKHWSQYSGLKQRLGKVVERAVMAQNLQPAERAVRIRFIWIEPDTRRDLDNITFGQKYILDGLVNAGILVDDTRADVAGIEHRFPPPEERGRVIVHLLEDAVDEVDALFKAVDDLNEARL